MAVRVGSALFCCDGALMSQTSKPVLLLSKTLLRNTGTIGLSTTRPGQHGAGFPHPSRMHACMRMSP